MVFSVSSNNEDLENSEWEVFTDAYNQTYIYCTQSKAIAYFTNDGTVLYFTSFSGDKNSLLYYFYLSAFKVFLGDFKSVTVQDSYPIHMVFEGTRRFLQDFIAPYYQYCKANYQSKTELINKNDNSYIIDSVLTKKVGQKTIETTGFKIKGDSKSFRKILINTNKRSFEISINLERY